MTKTYNGSAQKGRPCILCVDDEPRILEGLKRQFYSEFNVVGAESGLEALDLLGRDHQFAVLVSDMRMPGMDGTKVLAKARLAQPDTVRVLLTGQADLADAINAVNDGNIFRFLIKPCPPEVLRSALWDAVNQHRTITAERELLDETLRGAVSALLDALSLANPLAFARAVRIQGTVRELIDATNTSDSWYIEVAAAVSQIGSIVLAPDTLYKLNTGLRLSPEEELQVRTLPWHAERLLAHIPRLEAVCQIIHDQGVPFAELAPAPAGGERTVAGGDNVALGAQMLRVAVELEALEASGVEREDALSLLQRREGSYDPGLLNALLGKASSTAKELGLVPVLAHELRAGMRIARDVTDSSGRLLVGRGYEVTDSLIERIRNWKTASLVTEPIFIRPD